MSLEQALQGTGQSTKPVRVQGASGQRSQSYALVVGSPTRSRELDSMILIGASQLEIFYDPFYDLLCSYKEGLMACTQSLSRKKKTYTEKGTTH